MNENGKTNSVDLVFIHKVLLTIVVYWLLCVNSQITDKRGRILILDVTIDGSEYILVNIYNANKESKQLNVLNDLNELMKKVNITYGKQIVLADNFNLFFDRNLEAKGGKPILKEKSAARMVELKEENWKIVYLPTKSFLRYFKSQTRLYFYLKQAS